MTRTKRFLVTASTVAIVAATSGAALAADTQQTWQGLLTIYSATSQCAAVNANVGDFVTSVYRPKIAAGDSDTYLSFIYSRAALTFLNMSEATRHQMHGAGSYAATAINGRAKTFTFSSTYNLVITPTTVIASTPSVTIKGAINNFFGATGCTVNVAGGFGRRPN